MKHGKAAGVAADPTESDEYYESSDSSADTSDSSADTSSDEDPIVAEHLELDEPAGVIFIHHL